MKPMYARELTEEAKKEHRINKTACAVNIDFRDFMGKLKTRGCRHPVSHTINSLPHCPRHAGMAALSHLIEATRAFDEGRE
jgi:hypothetical protein